MEIAKKTSYTRTDYEALPEGVPYQLIEGKLVMSPAPTPWHQIIIGRLFIVIQTFIEKHKPGLAILSPVDVYLTETNAFQPDLVFISNERLAIMGDHIEGPPDLVIEILSPSTAYYDLKQKKNVYEAAGVREYWIVDPMERSIDVFVNGNEGFTLRKHLSVEGQLESDVLEGFSCPIEPLWEPIEGQSEAREARNKE